MNAYVVSASHSGTGVRFNLFENTASSFTLGTGLFMVSTDNDNIVLDGNAAWTVTINGAAAGLFSALWLKPGAGASKVTIGEEGSLRSAQFAALFAERDAAVTNKGIIHGTNDGVDLLGIGSSSLTNSGVIVGLNNAVLGAAGSDTVTNTGQVFGWIQFGNGTNKLVNSGHITASSFYGVSSANVTFGAGNDVFKGGNFNEVVLDGAGGDKISLGGGNDVFVAFGGESDGINGGEGDFAPDTVDGGAGIDTYDGSNVPLLNTGIYVNLDSVDHSSITKGTATNGNTFYLDNIKGFENATGGSYGDIIFGSSAVNVLKGGGGIDSLFGLAGNDVIDGGSGVDVIVGGLGADVLTGGGNDFFVIETLKDSGLTKATRDVITDFTDGEDTISLQALDADTRDTDNDIFGSIIMGSGTFTLGQAGQLRIYETSSGWMIEGEVNGDAKADFSIAVDDMDHSIVWELFVTDDFVA